MKKRKQQILISAKKLVAILLCTVMFAGVLPISELGLLFSASAEAPQYNSELGSVTVKDNGNGTSTLTATPNKYVGFRGWYLNGKEVNTEKSYTVPTSDINLYTAEYYDFNLISDGSFEQYEVGDNMKLQEGDAKWEGYCDNEVNGNTDWTSVVVTDAKANSGNKSIKTTARFNTTYRYISGLEANTQYTLSFWYTMEMADAYLSYAAVINSADAIDARANSNKKPFLANTFPENGMTANNEWKEISLTFYTGDLTSVCLVLLFGGQNVAENVMYIDDLAVVKDIFSAPTYGNRDFSNGYVDDWTLTQYARVSADTANKRLKVSPALTFAAVQASPYYLKKDYTYTVSFDLDLSELKYIYAPEVDRVINELVYDDNGELVFSSSINWINWTFSTEKGVYGSKALDADEKTVLNTSFFVCDKTTSNDKFFSSTVTDADGSSFTKYQYHSGMGFGILDRNGNEVYPNMDFTKPVTVTSTFTADHSGPMYINFRLNGIEEYYVDNIEISETEPEDKTELVNIDALSAVGIAIRLKGKQGIRYKSEIDKRLLTADNGFGVRPYEYGTIAIKSMYLGGKELTLDESYEYNGKVLRIARGVAYNLESQSDVRFLTKTNSIQYTGVLVGIEESNYQSSYSVRSYLKYKDKNGNDKTVYSATYDTSIFDVAKVAYTTKLSNGNFAENSADRAYLYNNILKGRYDRAVTIDDSEAGVIFNDYEGISSTIYHCYTFMPDSHGRTYTDEEAAIEMDRLADSGIDTVRTIFKGSFAAQTTSETKSVNLGDTDNNGFDDYTTVKTSETFTGYDWNSEKMQAFYKWAKMLQARDIDIILNAGWHLHFIAERESSIPELFYFLGYEDDYSDNKNYPGEGEYGATIKYGAKDIYNETANYIAAGGTLPSKEEAAANPEKLEERRLIIASLRYGEWVRQALAAAKRNGVNNITYLHPFTETGYEHAKVPIGTDENGKTIYKDGDEYDPTYCYDEYIIMVKGLHDALKKSGVRDDYKIIGPSQSIQKNLNKDASDGNYDRDISLLGYYLQWEKKPENQAYIGMINILSSHMYAKPRSHPDFGTVLTEDDDTIYHPTACYDSAELNYQYYMNKIIKTEGGGDPLNRSFWSDEYFANAGDITWKDGVGAQMTQFAAGMVAGINNGLQKQLSWQIFDQLWESQTNTGGEFVGGVHCCGTVPSFVTYNDTCPTVAAGKDCACQDYASYAGIAPRTTYYGINLLGRYLSSRNGMTSSVHKTVVQDDNGEGGVYVATIRLADGNLAILAVNTKSTSTALKFNFKNLPGGSTLKRYTYNPEGITPTEEAKALDSDGTVTLEGNTFYDTLADMSFAIYTNYEFSVAPVKPIEPDIPDVDLDMSE